jgi:hypothetical protein
MGQEVRIREAQPLTDQQAIFVAAILEGVEPEEAKKAAGYSSTTPPAVILSGKAVQKAIRDGCDGELSGTLRVKAMQRLRDLITNDKTPHATAFNAAKFIIERGDEDAKPGDKPLSEMTEEELVAVIDRLEEAKAARLIDVTPGNGAHPQQPASQPIGNAGE